ncbi:hypothetical protein [Solemya elarraichensis gill symbiont]|uniref:Uncharacterized protein n=1 Tax=Solemya elarraichensis gill symbiont TaxID=1918949 RepID=A0A1T2KYW3_9GAMM|nr:hypothetical protein [Solemya elarraichensis gill symbiont]OOZ38023.1 hypothetical protein BOW52_09585 [Solemya elarraichensis gill symbiont]
MATEKIWQYLQESDKRAYKEHARKIINTMLSKQIVNGSILDGAYSDNGITTTSATILEGLLASESLCRDEAAFHQQILESITAGMRFLLNAQVKNGPFRGAIPRSVALMSLEAPGADLFNSRATVVRIDYVQHVLAAYMQYLDLLDERD